MTVNTYIKNNPVGIDIKIQNLQKRLKKVLSDKWNLTTGDFFGRIYLEDDGDFVVPEFYNSKKEYISTLFNDKISVSTFFYVKDEEQIGINMFKSTVSNVWQFKTIDLKTVIHRADEEVLQDILNVYKDEPFGFSVQDIERGNNVYSDFNLRKKFINKEPRCVLRIDLEIIYKYSNC